MSGSRDPGPEGLLHIHVGPRSTETSGPPSKLRVPWQILKPGQLLDHSVLLRWSSGISRFGGRDREMKELENWALSPDPVSVKWITGAGGMGKSRLAAEFCIRMAEMHDWACGFEDPDEPNDFPLEQRGILVVIDNPAYKKESVKALLQGVAEIDLKMPVEKGKKIRLLFLSGQKYGDWQPIISEAGAEALVSPFPLELVNLPFTAAIEVFASTFTGACALIGSPEPALAEEAAATWINQAKENSRPQFIVAAAVFRALFPEENTLNLTARQIIEKLALREISRAGETAAAAGLKDPFLVPILQAMSNMGGALTMEHAGRIIGALGLEGDLPSGSNWPSWFAASGLFREGRMVPIEPDILAAAYTLEVLRRKPPLAAKLIWLSLENRFSASLFRFSRFCHDAETELDFDRNQLDEWLVVAISEDPDRGAALEPFLVPGLYGLAGTGVTACRICLERASDERQRMRLHDKAALFFEASQDRKEALRQRLAAVDICEVLAADCPEGWEPLLAEYYFQLWRILFETGERWKAYRVIEGTVKLYEKLASAQPHKFELKLAECLRHLGDTYAEGGEHEKALAVTEKALKIYEKRAALLPLAFGPALAACISSQGNVCAQLGETEKALTATKKAVQIFEQLNTLQPGAFEADLAAGFTHLGNRYVATGETAEALDFIQRALEIYEKLAVAQPGVFDAELAGCLSVQGNLCAFMGEEDQALEITERVVKIYTKLSEKTAVYDSLLAASLSNLSTRYVNAGKDVKALLAAEAAVSIYDGLAKAYPLVFDPHLATSLSRLGVRHAAVGDNKKALKVTERAIEVYTQLVAAEPQAFEPDLAACLNNQGNLLAQMGQIEKSLVATEMAVTLKEQLAAADPKYIPSLLKSLKSLEERYSEAGEEEKAGAIRKRAEEFQKKYFEPVH